MLNIVIPMAGAGSRFSNAGYVKPKPLIEINGVPMIKIVINNLTPQMEHRFIFVCQENHLERYQLEQWLSEWSPGCLIVPINGITEGAACTVLKAQEFIKNNDPLMIANSDQYIDVSIDDYLNVFSQNLMDGLIMTMTSKDPKWSFVGMENKFVTEVVEKKVISDEATVGIYNFSRGVDFVNGANKMIQKNLRVNSEFYVAPVYNELIKVGKEITIYNIGSEASGMYGLGIPSDLEYFLSTDICKLLDEKD